VLGFDIAIEVARYITMMLAQAASGTNVLTLDGTHKFKIMVNEVSCSGLYSPILEGVKLHIQKPKAFNVQEFIKIESRRLSAFKVYVESTKSNSMDMISWIDTYNKYIAEELI
jgi:hypothetical protein